MRALTINQPWADLIMVGLKDVENRTWPVPSTLPCHCLDLWCDRPRSGEHTPFPFRLWVHAAKREADYNRADLRALLLFSDQERWRQGRARMPGFDKRGVLLGSVLVTDCHHGDECGRHPGCTSPMTGDSPSWHFDECAAHDDTRRNLCSRWAEPGVYHWTLTDPQPLAVQIPMKGRQRLWIVPDDVAVPA